MSLPRRILAARVAREEFTPPLVPSLVPHAVVGICPARTVVDGAAAHSATFAVVAHDVVEPVVGLARIGVAREGVVGAVVDVRDQIAVVAQVPGVSHSPSSA
jgi:hypothetical protein